MIIYEALKRDFVNDVRDDLLVTKLYNQYQEKINAVKTKYDDIIEQIEQDYDIKQRRAKELVNKLFDPNHMAYERFTSSITKSNNLFSTQVDIAKKMAEMDINKNPFVKKELENSIENIPKLEGWQLQDYVYSIAEGVELKSLDWLISATDSDIYRIENELDKFKEDKKELAVTNELYERYRRLFNIYNSLLEDI